MHDERLSSDPRSDSRNSVSAFGLILIFLFALVPRMSGLTTVYNLDENWGASVRVLTGDLNGAAGLNMPLISYINAVSFVVLFAVGRLIGIWASVGEFRAQYFSDMTPFVFAGRFASACIGAASAPLAVLIGCRMGLTRLAAIVVGVLVALLPINVLLSHFARPDIGAASAILFLCWTILRKLDEPDAKGADILIGVAVAFALSIKQTNLFVAFPALVGLLGLLIADKRLSWSRIVGGLLVSIVTCVLVAIPLTIGVLRDVHSFLDYQRVSAVINARPGSLEQFARKCVPIFIANIGGTTAAGAVAYVLGPFIRRDARFLLFWASAAIGFIIFSVLAGGGVENRFVLPYVELGFTFGCIALLSQCERSGRTRFGAIALTVAIFASVSLGSLMLAREAIVPPVSATCGDLLRTIADPMHDKILSHDYIVHGGPASECSLGRSCRGTARAAGEEVQDRARTKARRAPEGSSQRQICDGLLHAQLPFCHGWTAGSRP